MATITFNEIPFSNPDLNNPGRAVEKWHGANVVNVPTEGINTPRHDVYYRFVWTKLEGRTLGSYNWAYFDGLVNQAIAAKQTLSFGIMTVFPGNEVEAGGQTFATGGGMGCYPEYVHNKMQSEAVKDWKLPGGQTWTPNYNSPFYAERLLAFHQALNAHIVAMGWEKHIGIIDVRGYGAWGEWHSSYVPGNNVSGYPTGTFPTVASLKKIVDAHTLGFPNFPLVAMIAGFDAHYLQNTWNSPEIGHYLLTTKNLWGPLGWRRDQWGATDSYLDAYLVNNTRTFNGVALNTLIMDKWTKAPITGEPPAWNPGDYYDLERQISLYRATSFGNGNYGVDPVNSTIKNRVRAASKLCGYRFKVTTATVQVSASNLAITMNWQNIGRGNCWMNWDIVFSITGTNFKAISKHKLKFFQPGSTPLAVVESFPLTGVAAGTYQLTFAVKDPNGVRANMALAITGGTADNVYSLGSIVVGSVTPPPNQGPVAAAGGDQEITLPNNSVFLTGSGTDPEGGPLVYGWAIVSGSGILQNANSQNTQLTGLTAGSTVVRLTVTDNQGAKGTDDIIVKVNPATVPPPVYKKIKSISTIVDYNVVTYEDNSQETIDA